MRRAIAGGGLLAAALCLPCPPALGQAPSQSPRRMEIILEKRENSNWRAVDPRLVLDQGDHVRFRIRTNFDGYLYVMNQSTSGRYTLLFPSEDTGQKNQIQAGREYLVPATAGSFRITGPAGHEIVYWLMTPVDLQGGAEARQDYVPLPPPPKPGAAPPALTPRCDDTVLRARGDCVDNSAWPKAVGEKEKLPENLAGRVPAGAGAAARELMFVRRQQTSVVAAPAASSEPAIFEFRLAHK